MSQARHDRYYAAYLLALEWGLRLGEVVGLSKQDVDFRSHQIHVHRQWLDKERRYGPTKHGRTRHVSFHPDSELAVVLKEAINSSPHIEAIFVTGTGNRIGNRKLSGYYFQRMILAAQVKRIRFHDLRHTFASWYMINSGEIWDLKQILGHLKYRH